MNDRVFQGIIAGAVAWFFTSLLNLIMFNLLHLTKLRFMDFGGVLAFNQRPQGLTELITGMLATLLMQIGLGVLFVKLIQVISSVGIVIKGAFYGAFVWFTIYSMMTFFRVEHIYPIDFKTGVSNLTASIFWGMVLAGTVLYLKRRVKTTR